MYEQLAFFDVTPIEPGHEEGTKHCPSCNKRFRVKRTYKPYCTACSNKHQLVIYYLKKANPIPDNHRCPVCDKSADELETDGGKHVGKIVTPWRLDHDHFTGQFRGYLCNNCNIGLGRFKDDPALLNKAIAYVSED
jgi:hypothetical protein